MWKVYFVVICFGVVLFSLAFLWLIVLVLNLGIQALKNLQSYNFISKTAPNIACTGFGLRLLLMGSFYVEFQPLAKLALSSPNQ